MQGYWAIMPICPPMLQGKMADQIWSETAKALFFLNFNHELSAVHRSCQNFVTVV